MKVYFGVIPSKEFYHPDVALDGKESYINIVSILEKYLKNMTYIDIYQTLSYDDYFKYDIHWKQEELGETVEMIAHAMGSGHRFSGDYTEHSLYPFYGMEATKKPINSKEPMETANKNQGETLIYLTNDSIDNSSVYHYENKETSKVYTLEEFRTQEPYGIFLSGADPLLTIENPLATTKQELIIFRDSFGSSLAPLLIEAYAKITLVDLRYIASDYVGEFITFTDQDVLILNSTQVLKNSIMLK